MMSTTTLETRHPQAPQTETPEPPAARPSSPAPAATLAHTMPMTPTVSSRRARWSQVAWKVAGVLIAITLVAWIANWWAPTNTERSIGITAVVTRTDLSIVASAGGELESSNTIDVVCEVPGQQNKIIEMVPEGTHVTKGQTVLQFDTADLIRGAAEAKIKAMKAEALAKAEREELQIVQNKADSEVAKAQLALTLARLDKKKYEEGEYGVLVDDLRGSIALAEAGSEEANNTLEYFQKLVKKGFRTPEQLRAKEQDVMRAQYFLSRDQAKLRVLEEFTRERQMVELEAKAEEANFELARAKSSRQAAVTKAKTDVEAAEVTERLEKNTLARLEKQMEQCAVKAPQDGIVVYASGLNESARIRLGAVVHFKQKLFSLPDMTQMRVKTFVHESVVQKVKPGMNAEIRIEAYPNAVLHGTVEDVSTFYDPERQWSSGGVKDYLTNVKIQDLPDVGLKPGMTAEVRIMIDTLQDVLAVPLHAVAEQDGKYYSYVVGPNGAERREVTLGESTGTFIEIKSGLSQGERVSLDGRARLASELAKDQRPRKDAVPEESGAVTSSSTETESKPSL